MFPTEWHLEVVRKSYSSSVTVRGIIRELEYHYPRGYYTDCLGWLLQGPIWFTSL